MHCALFVSLSKSLIYLGTFVVSIADNSCGITDCSFYLFVQRALGVVIALCSLGIVSGTVLLCSNFVK